MVKKNIKLQSFSFSEIVYLPKLNLLFYKCFKSYLLSWGKKKKKTLFPLKWQVTVASLCKLALDLFCITRNLLLLTKWLHPTRWACLPRLLTSPGISMSRLPMKSTFASLPIKILEIISWNFITNIGKKQDPRRLDLPVTQTQMLLNFHVFFVCHFVL